MAGAVQKSRSQHSYNKADNSKTKKDTHHRQIDLQIQFTQLIVCLMIFAVVFIGKGAFPDRILSFQTSLNSLMSTSIDYKTVFQSFGQAIDSKTDILQKIGDVYQEVFSDDSSEDNFASLPELTNLLAQEKTFLNSDLTAASRIGHYSPTPVYEIYRAVSEQNDHDESINEPVAAAGTVIMHVDYTGTELPTGYTMDQISLGGLNTITPLSGRINSVYGYRDHPINGRYQFHGGVDIGGQTGDTIQAFADGIVDYVGEDDSYGLYLQLDHGNGIKSFYAHCSSICVQKGQTVFLGEKIGEVGSSGAATGPHLHLEIKYKDLRVDPSYYIDCLSNQ